MWLKLAEQFKAGWEQVRAALPDEPLPALILAVSGGADSLAMTHLLLNAGISPQLIVAHLDHAIRPDSAIDAHFVQQMAGQWGLPCQLGRVDVPALARQSASSLEEAARTARYQFLASVAQAHHTRLVLTAHHADDQVETILMHLLRGSGLAGLRGMQPVSPLPTAPDKWLLRPLLLAERSAIDAYLQHYQITPRQDPSNQDTTFFRNRLRHHIIPALEQVSPQLRSRLGQLASVVAADYDFLESACRQQLERLSQWQTPTTLILDREGWQMLPLALRRGVLRLALFQLLPALRDLGFVNVERARQLGERGEVGKVAQLPASLWLRVGYGELIIGVGADQPPANAPQLPDERPIPLSLPGQVTLAGGWQIRASQGQWTEAEIAGNPHPFRATIQLPPGTPLLLRPRQPGERIMPLGMAGHSTSLKKLMNQRHIPTPLRPLWPLVATPHHPVWLVGYDLDHRVQVTDASQPVWELSCSP